MGAAMLMSHIMACLHLLHDEGLEPLPLVERLHRQVFRSSRPSDFVTLFYGQLDPEAQTLHYVNGGHCPGLLFRGDGTETELPPTGLPVGMILNRGYEAASTQLAPGDLLCVYSDGIPEAFLGEDELGEERLQGEHSEAADGAALRAGRRDPGGSAGLSRRSGGRRRHHAAPFASSVVDDPGRLDRESSACH